MKGGEKRKEGKGKRKLGGKLELPNSKVIWSQKERWRKRKAI